MDNQRYRVVLTGELHPGVSAEAALTALAGLFHASVSELSGIFDGTEHPVDQLLTADAALELQESLDRSGVRCRVVRESEVGSGLRLRQGTAVSINPAPAVPASQAGLMNCPACGHQQLVSRQCESCGIVFSEYRRNPTAATPSRKVETTPVAGVTPSPVQAGGTSSPPPLQDDWQNDWLDSEENEPGEEHYLALFFGPPTEQYLNICDRYLSGPRTRFGLGWNWAAFFSPFIWSLYRKMWGWSLVIFVTEVIVPMLLIVMGSYEIISAQLVYVGYAAIALNRLFWPLLANFLYCSHARGTLQRMHMMAPNYAAEIDIATAGGVSVGAVLAGLAVAAVMSMFLWSVVDSISEPKQVAFLPEQFERPRSSGQKDEEHQSAISDLTGVSSVGKSTENKWVVTRRVLRAIGQQVNSWLAKDQGREAAQLTMFKLREEIGLSGEQVKDAWGADIQFIPNNEGYRLISSGPDRLFGTADDIQYQRVVGEGNL